MPEDADAHTLDAVAHDVQRALADAAQESRVGEARRLVVFLRPSLEEGAGRVVADPLTVDLDLMERADQVLERAARGVAQRRSDAEVPFESDAQPERGGVVDVSKHVVVVPHLVAPREMVGHAVRTHLHRRGAPRERYGAVRAVAMDVVIEECVHGSGCPAQAASTSVQRTPETRA